MLRKESHRAATSSFVKKERRVIGEDFDTLVEDFSIDRVTVGKMVVSHVFTDC